MPEHRSAQQLHCRVLLRRRQRSEARGMWALRDHPALSQVGSLLDPATEGHAAALENAFTSSATAAVFDSQSVIAPA
jgi:hypothetical protein